MFWHHDRFRYDEWINNLKKSKSKLLRDHYLLGVASWTGEPILVPKDLVNEHIWVTGGSGSGKSALCLAPFASQVIERKDTSVVWIDQKGDMPSFWNCFDAAYAAKMPFKYFSLVPGEESYVFNFLRQDVHRRFTAMQRAEMLAQSAGIDYGEVYGGAFFQGKSELALCTYLTNFTDPPLEDFVELFRLFDDKHSYAGIGHAEDWEDASHLRALFARLASVSSLNATPRNCDKPRVHDEAMDIFELLRTPTVYYFKLPASAGRNTGRFVARSVLQTLFASAGFRGPEEDVPVVVVMDEFQELVGPSIDVFLEQCRSRDISCVLAHQSMHQLERNNANLLPVIQACTSSHVVLEATDWESVQYVQRRSGHAVFAAASWSQHAPAFAPYTNSTFDLAKASTPDGIGVPLVNVREEIGYRLDENTIHKVSADPMSAFVAIKKNSGFSNFDGFMFPMRCFFHVDKALFDRRRNKPWPTWDRPGTVIVNLTNSFMVGSKKGPARAAPIKIAPPPPRPGVPPLDRLRKKGPPPQPS